MTYKRKNPDKLPQLPLAERIAKGIKRCPTCTEIKPHSEFHRSHKRDDGVQPLCKICQTAAVVKNYDPVQARAYCHNYYATPHGRRQRARWYQANRPRILAEAKARYQRKKQGLNHDT